MVALELSVLILQESLENYFKSKLPDRFSVTLSYSGTRANHYLPHDNNQSNSILCRQNDVEFAIRCDKEDLNANDGLYNQLLRTIGGYINILELSMQASTHIINNPGTVDMAFMYYWKMQHIKDTSCTKD